MKSSFIYPRRVAFHETDAMGVVHHSNHVKYFEEARVEWLRDRGLIEFHHPYGPYVFAVAGLETRYHRPARFDEELETLVQAKLEGIRLQFRYALWSKRQQAWVADGATTLVAVNEALKPVRLPKQIQEVFGSEPWDQAWPPPSPGASAQRV